MQKVANLKELIKSVPEPAKIAVLIVLLSKIIILSTAYNATYVNEGGGPPLAILQNLFNRWDASNYVDIAKNGYVNTGNEANFIVFFPLYPLLIKAFTFDFAYANIVALAISNVSSLIAFLYLYKLAKLEFNQNVAVKSVLLLSFFPLAYFLCVPYTEGLFFALVISGFYYARLGRWHLVGLIGFLAALTRLAGLLLLPVFLVEYLHQQGWKPKKIGWSALAPFSALAGFLIYLNINNQITGSPFTFMAIESEHWFNRLDPISGLKSAWWWATQSGYPSNLAIGIAPLVFAFFGFAMVGLAVWRRLRPSYAIYMFLSWGLAVSTAWWISVPRYIMAMFPMFFLLSLLIKRKAAFAAVAAASCVALLYFTVLFAIGWWAF
ncbi:MAG: glycosyltransferase family 39 protein [Candidatus Bathyarchaeota archaeon]|nr:glycosyltransferase family 39 protein [Candidatus Bathyarchaeota archaeon]